MIFFFAPMVASCILVLKLDSDKIEVAFLIVDTTEGCGQTAEINIRDWVVSITDTAGSDCLQKKKRITKSQSS